MNEAIAGSLAARRFSMILLNAFAISALLLASIGIYGVISYLVGQRTHELGIRRALGAQRSDLLGLILSHGMKMVLGGMALGLIAALGLTRLLSKSALRSQCDGHRNLFRGRAVAGGGVAAGLSCSGLASNQGESADGIEPRIKSKKENAAHRWKAAVAPQPGGPCVF